MKTSLIIATPSGQSIAEKLRRELSNEGEVELLVIAENESRGDVAARLAAFANGRTISLVVLALIPQDAVVPGDLTAAAPATWQNACLSPLKLTLNVVQALYDVFATQGGVTVAVLGPHFALSGAAKLVPLVTLAEGQRALTKASARQFAASGFRFHWIGLRAGQYHPALDGVAVPRKADPVSIALKDAPAMEFIAQTLAFLASDAGRNTLTGATLMLDGGEWMAP